jgi:hypothetical protein
LNDFKDDKRLTIVYNKNNHQQINYIKAMTATNKEYDLYIKIDDDDIYTKDYIKNSIEHFNNNDCDILSYTCNKHINGQYIKNKIASIGEWKEDKNAQIKFGMPSSFIFNKQAFDLIKNITVEQSRSVHPFEDGAWKSVWRQNNLKSVIIDTDYTYIYNIHHNNTSSKFLLDAQNKYYINTSFATIVYCEHPHWSSYVFLNKRNNRIYNIQNNDHGVFNIENNRLKIKWDEWGDEIYDKINNKDNNIYYKFIKKV